MWSARTETSADPDHGRRHAAEGEPLDQLHVHRAHAEVAPAADRLGDRRVDDVGADRRGRLDPEDQDQQRRHQRASAHAGHTDEHADAQSEEDDCRVHDVFAAARGAYRLSRPAWSGARSARGYQGCPSRFAASATPTPSCGRSRELDLEVAEHEVVGLVGPSGCGKSTLLELICGLLEPSDGEIAVGGRDDGPGAPRASAPTCPSATSCCPGTRHSTTRRWPCATAASARPRRGGRRGRCSSASASPASRARRRPSSPAGCASASPSSAPSSPASRCWRSTSPSPRSTRSPGRRCRSGWPRRSAPTRARSSSSPTTSRRRSTSPTASSSSPPARPGSSPSCGAPNPRAPDRDAAVTDPAFVAIREQALHALARSSAVRNPRNAWKRNRGTMRRWLLPILLLAALIGAWQLAASSGFLADVLGLDSFLVPSPAEVGEALWHSRSLLAENAWVTLREILLGLGCALVVGVVFALLDAPLGRRSATPPTRWSSPRRRSRSSSSRRSSWSGSASGSAPRSSSSP